MSEPCVLIVVPARGGSTGVPRKNTRLVGGVPLVVRACLTLDAAAADPGLPCDLRVVVSTDDPTVAELARVAGVEVIERDPHLSGPLVPVHDVVVDVAHRLAWSGPVGAFQPTAATLEAESVVRTLRAVLVDGYGSASTVVEQHGQWWAPDGEPLGALVNRQQAGAPTLARETGGLRVVESVDTLCLDGWFTSSHRRVTVPEREAVDVDTPLDFATARIAAEQGDVVFVVAAGDDLGSGHVRRALTLADELSHHRLRWCWATDEVPGWAWSEVTDSGLFDGTDLWPCDLPDGAAVVFDKLDTTPADLAAVWAVDGFAVSLEDTGAVAAAGNLTVNELYPVGTYSGPAWAVLRPEFVAPFVPPPGERRVLVTFGGTDPARLSERVAWALAHRQPWSEAAPVAVTVLAGSGRPRPAVLDGLPVQWVRDGRLVSELMRDADVVVTSCGRTVNEAAAVGRPVVAIAANHRELEHVHTPEVTYLGLHVTVDDRAILRAVDDALADPERGVRARAHVPPTGAQRIARLIEMGLHP